MKHFMDRIWVSHLGNCCVHAKRSCAGFQCLSCCLHQNHATEPNWAFSGTDEEISKLHELKCMSLLISKYLRPCVNFVVLFHVLDGTVLRYGAIRKQDRIPNLVLCSVGKNRVARFVCTSVFSPIGKNILCYF